MKDIGDVDEEALIGQPFEEAPKVAPAGECNGRKWEKSDGEQIFAGYCGQPEGWGVEDTTEGRCKHHGGLNSGENGQGAQPGNNNAATHGAYSESFLTDFLTEEEISRVEQAEELLGTSEGAQAIARTVAATALEQYRRAGDERFLRRYESICDTFGIAPADEVEVNGEISGQVTGEFAVDITHHRVAPDEDDDEPEQ